MAKFN